MPQNNPRNTLDDAIYGDCNLLIHTNASVKGTITLEQKEHRNHNKWKKIICLPLTTCESQRTVLVAIGYNPQLSYIHTKLVNDWLVIDSAKKPNDEKFSLLS